jgi:hypothetical protein
LFCENCGASLKVNIPAAPPAEFNLPPTVVIPGNKNTPDSITEPGTPSVAEPKIPSATLTCANCGAILELDSSFCDMCGTPVKTVSTGFNHKSPASSPPEMASPIQDKRTGSDVTTVGGYEISQEYSRDQVDNYGVQQQNAATQVGDYAAPHGIDQTRTPYQNPQPAYGQTQAAHTPSSHVAGRLVIPGTNINFPLDPSKVDIVVGREDPIGSIYPDIDLTDFGGDKSGVSRQHARITLQANQYYITDLQSTNFTYVNQQRLAPNLPTPLHDGDEIKFGKLKMFFYQST